MVSTRCAARSARPSWSRTTSGCSTTSSPILCTCFRTDESSAPETKTSHCTSKKRATAGSKLSRSSCKQRVGVRMSQVAERTMSANAHVARYIADYQRAKSPTQPAWLGRARDLALTSFERLGFPTTRLEDWRFTPVGPLVDVPFTLAVDGVDASSSFS